MTKIFTLSLFSLILVACGGGNPQERLAQYEAIGPFSEGYAWALNSEGLAGFINEDGKPITDFKYRDAYPFINGFAPVKNAADRWGFIDTKGKEVIPLEYKAVSSFSEYGIAIAQNPGNKYGMINTQNEAVVPFQFHQMFDFSDGVTPVNYAPGRSQAGGDRHGKWGIYNNKGKEVLACVYFIIDPFSEGLAAFHPTQFSDGGYLNTQGEVVIEPKWRQALPFSHGVAKVTDNNTYWGLIDKEGSLVVQPVYRLIGDFKEGLARVYTKEFSIYNDGPIAGYMNPKGEIVIPLEFDGAQDFSEGYAAVMRAPSREEDTFRNPQKWAFIDKQGKPICGFDYDKVGSFSDGMAKVHLETKGYGFINTSGELVIPCQYTEAGDFVNGKAQVKSYDKVSWIGKDGQPITE